MKYLPVPDTSEKGQKILPYILCGKIGWKFFPVTLCNENLLSFYVLDQELSLDSLTFIVTIGYI